MISRRNEFVATTVPRRLLVPVWPRIILYAHCAVAIACASIVAYGMAHYDPWPLHRRMWSLLRYPGASFALNAVWWSCLGFPCLLTYTAQNRVSAWRLATLIGADLALSVVQHESLCLLVYHYD